MTYQDNWQRRLQGYAPMSAKSMAVLQHLLVAKAQEWPFVSLDHVHKRTLNALFEADLIAESIGADGVRYKITARGERTLQAYSRPSRRTDGICPTCGERPKFFYSTGRRAGYCRECEAELTRR